MIAVPQKLNLPFASSRSLAFASSSAIEMDTTNTPCFVPLAAANSNLTLEKKRIGRTKSSEYNLSTGCLNLFDFATPGATLKMGHISADISPTTENTLFSGACLSVRMLESLNVIDLNSATFDDDYNVLSGPKKICLSRPYFSISFFYEVGIS